MLEQKHTELWKREYSGHKINSAYFQSAEVLATNRLYIMLIIFIIIIVLFYGDQTLYYTVFFFLLYVYLEKRHLANGDH